MFQRSILSDSDVVPLAEGVLRVLDEVGIVFQCEEGLQALEAAGARVSYADQTATFPPAMVRQFVETLQRETDDGGRDARPTRDAKFHAPGLAGIGMQISQFFHDGETGQVRPGNKADLITLTKFGDVLHQGGPVGHSLLLTDVPPFVEPLETALILAEYARESEGGFAWTVDQIPYLVEMGEILGKPDWFTWGAICIAHPLRFDREVARKFHRRVQEGLATGLTAMPVAGATTPVTVEGFVVVSSAEHVAAWLTARTINPEVGLHGSQWGGTVDMKTGSVSFCSWDAMLYAFAGVEFLRRWTGVNVSVGGGEYCAAKAPGMYALMEKAHKAMLIAAFSGEHPSIGCGHLDDGKLISMAQLLIERDASLGAGHLARTLEPTEANLALDTILTVGHGMKTNYLMADQTLRNYRQNLWLPELIDRSGWKGEESDRAMLERARGKVREMLAQYQKPEGRGEQLAAMRAVVERARRER